MSNSMTEVLDRAFGHPRGLLGRLGGLVMAHGNGPTERRMVEMARLTAEETALIIGPGPGVGLEEAAQRALRAVAVDPSAEMLALCRHRCAQQVAEGEVELREGSAESTGQEESSIDVVLSVNNVQLWDDRPAGFAELYRVLRPGGRLLLSAHDKWLPVPRHALAAEVEAAGFSDLQTWVWEPPGTFSALAAQLRAVKPRQMPQQI
jgi:ubiquinone/menaquinone biosynthesis C-methylase UbiE